MSAFGVRVYRVALLALVLGGCAMPSVPLPPALGEPQPEPPRPIVARDWDLLIRAADLSLFGVRVANPEPLEETDRKYFADGSIHLSYRFTNLDRERGTPLSMIVRVSIEPNEPAAERVFVERSSVSAIGALGRDVRWRDEFFTYGDESRFGYIFVNDEPNGTLFHCRNGTRLFSFVVAGLVIDDAEAWARLVLPRLEALQQRSAGPG